MAPTHAEVRVQENDDENEMVVGRMYPVVCTVYGSRPPARITWYINSTPIGKLEFVTFARISSQYPKNGHSFIGWHCEPVSEK